MTATPRFKLRLHAPHRVRNLARGVPTTVEGATRTLRVPLPLVPRTASLLLHARATDNTGYTQTPDRADPVPDGATGWHSITFAVR